MYKIIGADGQEYGPVTVDQMRQWIAEGRADAQTRVQAVGATLWQSLGSVPELAALLSVPTPPVAPVSPAGPQPNVPNYLVQSILATLFCCLPFGIVAIIYAAQVNSKLQAGDVAGAQTSSRKARRWCWISVASWGVVALIYGIIFLVMLAVGAVGAAGVSGR